MQPSTVPAPFERANDPPWADLAGNLTYSLYWNSGGGHFVLRAALDSEHPECLYNYIKRAGFVPEDYGIEKSPSVDDQKTIDLCASMSRQDLIQEILSLRRQIQLMEEAGL
ncbi:hypothetical protein FDI24_gp172 [Acidovorax phage ACP17]|uniref:Uncharacterized protein n=1 Tax=Acidovorax phage ACP17 TaxID=2010329 RepID=A0A218M336_9CAUD|nr:hypothetical protein FDI24_gp172 [Acidovorax phage ACP17]ASD50454.1 hypothetical protein [Acidovorax phage ACP17]